MTLRVSGTSPGTLSSFTSDLVGVSVTIHSMGCALKSSGLALMAAVALAAPAGATPEQDYLNTLAGTPGVTVNPFTSVLLTNAGYASCADLRAGVPLEEVAVRQLSFPGSTLALTRIMVAAAQQTLCPDTA